MIRRGDTREIELPKPTTTRRVQVEYEVIQKQTYGGSAVLDVPIDKLNSDGSVDTTWAREHMGELECTDSDVLPDQVGGGETARWTVLEGN